ncbi:hypothetical protein D777_00143 [Marinobacter nitratireducens]|uniref:Uncharacterized protein n=1 Tax=Marinobacter nitratireducens TaxID=1137280 RepID=A0A072NJ34_9GAMM|nr:hypothetical protein D777_00143 [Marinobacter nitratireducens]
MNESAIAHRLLIKQDQMNAPRNRTIHHGSLPAANGLF